MTRLPLCWVRVAFVLGAAAGCSTTSSAPRSTQPASTQPVSTQPAQVPERATAIEDTQPAQVPERATAIEDTQPVQVACEDVGRGTVVAFTPFDIPSSCGAAASARDHEITFGEPRVRVLADAAAYRRELRCEDDGPIDFGSERLAVYSYVRISSEVYRLSEVRSLDGNIVLVFDVERRCQGVRQRAHAGDLAVRIPRGEEPLGVAVCVQQARCDALPP